MQINFGSLGLVVMNSDQRRFPQAHLAKGWGVSYNPGAFKTPIGAWLSPVRAHGSGP